MDTIIFDVSLVSFIVLLVGLLILPERRVTSTVASPAPAGA